MVMRKDLVILMSKQQINYTLLNYGPKMWRNLLVTFSRPVLTNLLMF